jgi:hypothetical protein
LTDLKDTRPNPNRPESLGWYGRFAKDVQDISDPAFIVLPDLDERHLWGPARWQARDAVTLPNKGDECMALFDNRRQLWIPSWWTGSPPTPPEISLDEITPGANGQWLRTLGGAAVWDTVTSMPPSGAAGGVLGGTYPNPSFAADMATQVELDAEAAARIAADALKAPLASPALTGVPTSTTPGAGDSSTKIATTAFVRSELPFLKVGQQVAAGGETTLTVGSIPGTYTNLLFVFKMRQTASGSASVALRFSGDSSAAYYDTEFDFFGGSIAAHAVGSGATSGRFGRCPGSDAGAGQFGSGYVFVPSYAAGDGKNWIGKTSSFETAGIVGEEDAGCWFNGAAVTSVSILGVTFAAGSRLDVYVIS